MDERYNLTKRQILAIILIIIVTISGYFIVPIVLESLSTHNKLQESRDFDITFAYNFNQQIINFENQKPDIEIDLKFHYPYGILTVDEPVEISGTAVLNNTPRTQRIHSLTMYIDNAQEYPIKRTDEGFTKGADLLLARTPNKSILVGNKTVVWTVEGTYHALLAITESINDTHSRGIIAGQATGVAITVYPKSQSEQMATNRAVLYLTIAIYLATLVGSLSTAFYLWDSKQPSHTNANDSASTNNSGDAANKNSNITHNQRRNRISRFRLHANHKASNYKKTRYRK
jgi:hypothetical protein